MILADDWMPVDGLELEPNAMAAVREVKKNVVILAGPGAGKTELLAQRADYLFRTGASPYPQRILAISFKVDAARNLKSRVRLRSGPQFSSRFDSFTFHAFAKRLIDNYRPSLKGENALRADYRLHARDRIQGEQITFDDLVPLAIEILSSNAYASGALRQTYSHVFMDEFQDATSLQYEFLLVAFGETPTLLTGVGDTKQRIMSFAGALDGVMNEFASDFDAVRLQLYQNFRSKPHLRRMQNRMILDMDPSVASPNPNLSGGEGKIHVMQFEADSDEASGVADIIAEWLRLGISPTEIAVLVRQQPHLVAARLGHELSIRGISSRNEQEFQDLAAEPAAALVLDFLRVIADDRHPSSYSELARVVTHGAEEDSDGLFHSRFYQLLSNHRVIVRSAEFDRSQASAWKPLVAEFLKFVTLEKIRSLSPSYMQGGRLSEILTNTFQSFENELKKDGNPVASLHRLSESNAIRVLTIHKCKGLEFEKVIVLGVEKQLFWGEDESHVMSEFFVAISRAKEELVLTYAGWRNRPPNWKGRWETSRTAHDGLLAYAYDPHGDPSAN